jgi:hypothetical protein
MYAPAGGLLNLAPKLPVLSFNILVLNLIIITEKKRAAIKNKRKKAGIP